MPRALKSDKFFIYTPKKSGHCKGKMMLGINDSYEGGIKDISLQDLVDFLNEKEIDFSKVEIPGNFITLAKEPNLER